MIARRVKLAQRITDADMANFPKRPSCLTSPFSSCPYMPFRYDGPVPWSEILLIVWGLIFISRNEEPDLAFRNFAKAVKAGQEVVIRGAVSLSSSVSTTASRKQELPNSVSSFRGEDENPCWDIPLGGTLASQACQVGPEWLESTQFNLSSVG